MSQARAEVMRLKSTPAAVPPKAMEISPQGTKNVARGRTMRLVMRKYVLT